MRLFVALWPPEPLAMALDAWLAQSRAFLADAGWKATPAGQGHLTLSFLGEVPEAQLESLTSRLRDVAVGRTAPRLSPGNLGVFPSERRPRVLWIGVLGDLDLLASLQREVTQAMHGYQAPAEDLPFHPHLTLARRPASSRKERLAGVPNQPALVRPEVSDLTWSRFRLVCSERDANGARYRTVAEMPLLTTR